MKRVIEGEPSTIVPDTCRLGLDQYEEYLVPQGIQFGQARGYTLEFAAACQSKEIPNCILVLECRKNFGVFNPHYPECTCHWAVLTREQYDEWYTFHELQRSSRGSVKVDIDSILKNRMEAAYG